jgi:cysteine-rich repeat protein
MMRGSETCDDGNIEMGDGCAQDCRTETGWECNGQPSVCQWVDPDWVFVPAGSFDMGSPTGELGRETDEAQHTVTLTQDFVMLATEVTQLDFTTLMGYDPSYHSTCGNDCPVEGVHWHQAAAYCNKLSTDMGLEECYSCMGANASVSCTLSQTYNKPYNCLGFRLPTEAEWEYAARAGTTTATYNGDLDSDYLACEASNPVLDEIAWFCGNTTDEKHPVAQKNPNSWGLYDMLGNVWEWCHDWYDDYPTGSVTNPAGPQTGDRRVGRGGSYHHDAVYARAANRHDNLTAHTQAGILGFRPVRTLP